MARSLSIHDFEEWYRGWCEQQSYNTYILETSMTDVLQDGTEVFVHAHPCPIKSRRRPNKQIFKKGCFLSRCLFHEKVDFRKANIINDLVMKPKYKYELDLQSAIFLLVHKYILYYDCKQFIRYGGLYNSLVYEFNSYFLSNKILYNNDINDISCEPMWRMDDFIKHRMSFFEYDIEHIDDKHSTIPKIIYHQVPSMYLITKPMKRLLLDGTIETYVNKSSIRDTPFLSFVVHLLDSRMRINKKNYSVSRKMKEYLPVMPIIKTNTRDRPGKSQGTLVDKYNLDREKRKHESTAKQREEANVFRQEGDFGTISSQMKHEQEKSNREFRFSPGFTTVNLRGEKFYLTEQQSIVVEILWDAYVDGTPDVREKEILGLLKREDNDEGEVEDMEDVEDKSQTGSHRRLRDLFHKRLENWQNLIVSGKRRGTYRLNINPDD